MVGSGNQHSGRQRNIVYEMPSVRLPSRTNFTCKCTLTSTRDQQLLQLRLLANNNLGPNVRLKVTDLRSGRAVNISNGGSLREMPFFAVKSMSVELFAPRGEFNQLLYVWLIRELGNKGN